MNKLLGFLELKDSLLPAIPWMEYNKDTVLDSRYLWTIRTAVFKGEDLNLPRLVGATADEAKKFADELLYKYHNKGIIIFYPYFFAEKSGTLNVYLNKIVVEAVKDDLWNLVTYSNRDVTIQIENNYISYDGNRSFLKENELNELINYVPKIRAMFRDYLIEGKSILLEWSFAYTSDINKNKIGDKYLVFYEARTV